MRARLATVVAIAASSMLVAQEQARPTQTPAGGAKPGPAGVRAITEADCTAAKLGSGDSGRRHRRTRVGGHARRAAVARGSRWRPGLLQRRGKHGAGRQEPRRRSPIRFGVALPASWAFRAAHMGGGGNNGTIPRLTGGIMRGGAPLVQQGFATYGSDSGHQAGRPPGYAGPGRGAGAPDPAADDWALNDEAVAISATCS